MQVVDNKKKEKEILRALDQVLLIKDLNIEKRFRDLKNFNEGCNNDDDDDDDDNNIGQLPRPSQYLSSDRRNICHHRLEETNHHFHVHCQFRQQLL